MTKKILLFFLLFSGVTIAFAQRFDKTYGHPVIVFTEMNPRLLVIGSDVPTFALYEKGQIIYKKVESGRTKFFEVKLSEEETQKAVYSLGLNDSLMRLPGFIETTTKADQPTNELVLSFDSTKIISVYGNLRVDQKARKETPKPFLKVYDRIARYENSKAREWVPSTIEVMLSDYSNSPEVPQKWPKGWSDLKSSKTVKRSDRLYSLYLDKRHWEEFRKLLGSLKKKQAVEVNGRKFSVSYRLPFPNLR